MKNYKKGLFTLTVLTAMSLVAAEQDTTIYVNTFADEDGENESKCSLREALTAASLHRAYGGCLKGQQYSSVTNIIQLEKGVYNLTKELQPNSPVVIRGKNPEDYTRKGAITNNFPAAIPIQTTISGQNVSRIFNTTNGSKPNLTLQNLILKDAKSTNVGGTLLVGGVTELSNVSIENSTARSGGAIYLNDVNSSLTIKGGEFSGNKAATGSILAMSCLDNLKYTPRKIDIITGTYINNGAADNQSLFAFCGQPNASILSNTFTENIVNQASGSIFQFHSFLGNDPLFSTSSGLSLLSNTIVKNTAQAILAYNNAGTKSLKFNVIGFNKAKACRYTNGDVSQLDSAGIEVFSNALHLTNTTEQCELPRKILENAKLDTIVLDGQVFENLFDLRQDPQEMTGFMSMYFPKDNNTKTDLVDVAALGCYAVDQRGVLRLATSNTPDLSDIRNTCDIGATELQKLTAVNLSEINISVTGLLKRYQDRANDAERFLNDSTTDPELLPSLRIRLEENNNLKKNTEAVKKYRPIFIDPFSNNLPYESVESNGGRKIEHLTAENYDVVVSPEGVGKLESNGVFMGRPDPNLKCEWNQALQQIIMYRTDDRLTPSGDKEFCKYTIILNKEPKASASAYVSAQFVNIAPNVPDNTDIVVEYASNTRINLDILKIANDDGDGTISAIENNPNKSAFYLNERGETQAIRFNRIPSTVNIRADRQGACPGLDSKEVCYGGNITAQLNNSLDVFNYRLEYRVYDADGDISNTGTISLKNTAIAANSVRVSGGGAMGWLSLFALFGLGLFRRLHFK